MYSFNNNPTKRHIYDEFDNRNKIGSCPTLQHLGKHLAPPGSTPIGSYTDVAGSGTCTSTDLDIPRLSRGVPIKQEPFDPISLKPRRKKEFDSNANCDVYSANPVFDVEHDLHVPNEVWENDKTLNPKCSKRSAQDRHPMSTNFRPMTQCTYTAESSCGSEYSNSRPPCTTQRGNGGSECGNETCESLIFHRVEQPPAPRRFSNPMPQLKHVMSKLKENEVVLDRNTAVKMLKARILRGEKVTHDEIMAMKDSTMPAHQRHLGFRLPWTKDLYCDKGLVRIPTPNSPAPAIGNTFGTVDDLRLLIKSRIPAESKGRRQYVVSLAGFKDKDISLYLEGKNRLVIRAVRPDRGNDHSMVVTETVLLPPDLDADNLRIVRTASGTTIVDESWRF